MLSAAELHRRGREQGNAGRHAAARKSLTIALARAIDPNEHARILTTLAYVESETGNVETGLALCRRALVDRTQLGAGVVGVVTCQIALLHMRSGAMDQALSAFESGLPSLVGQPEDLGLALLHRGDAYLQLGQAGAAVGDFERARHQFGQIALTVEAAKAEHNLGYARLLTGDLIGALRTMDSAAVVLRPLSAAARATVEQDRAEVLVAAGMTTEAEQALVAAARAYGERRLRQAQGEAELVLARMLVLDDPRRSRTVARRASRRFTARGSASWALRADAVAIAAELELGRVRPALHAEADRITSALRDHGLGRDAFTLASAVALGAARTAEPGVAASRLRTLRTSSRTPITDTLRVREARAALAARRGRRSDAAAHVRKGLAELHSWQSSFGGLDLQTSIVGHGRRLALLGLRLAVEDGRPATVFAWSERARMLATRVAPVRPPTDEQTSALLSELRHLRTREDDLDAEDRARERQLQQTVRERAWHGAGSGITDEPVSFDELTAGLDDTALIAHLEVDGELVALVATADDARVISLGPYGPVRELLGGMQADLDVSATALPERLRRIVDAGLAARVDGLHARLLEPLMPYVGDRRVVLTPSGALAGTPWSMLPSLRARPTWVATSASSWLRRRAEPQAYATAAFVAGPDVARAEEEVRRASKLWRDPVCLAGAEARADAVSALSCDVLHVSAHGRHSADNPLFSGVELAGGPWFGYDIDQLDHVPALVVLSACELGRSSIRWGEEALGMTNAWLHAGARAVIAAPARVNDDDACETLSAFHQHLADGRDPAEALAYASAGRTPFLCFT